jgi:hypothetical protein
MGEGQEFAAVPSHASGVGQQTNTAEIKHAKSDSIVLSIQSDSSDA